MPDSESFFAPLIQPLDQAAIPYMVTGGAAAIIYGEPRLTLDVDVVILIQPGQVKGLHQSFPESRFYVPPEDVIREEASRSDAGHFNIIHHESGLRADVYCVGQDSLNQWGLQNRRQIEVEGLDLWVAPPEFVILKKMAYYREGQSEKHLLDIRAMLKISSDDIDLKEISYWVNEIGLIAEWNLIRPHTP